MNAAEAVISLDQRLLQKGDSSVAGCVFDWTFWHRNLKKVSVNP
jgi:hypothetical protein